MNLRNEVLALAFAARGAVVCLRSSSEAELLPKLCRDSNSPAQMDDDIRRVDQNTIAVRLEGCSREVLLKIGSLCVFQYDVMVFGMSAWHNLEAYVSQLVQLEEESVNAIEFEAFLNTLGSDGDTDCWFNPGIDQAVFVAGLRKICERRDWHLWAFGVWECGGPPEAESD